MIYSIIPARAGSKGVPGKNIKLLGGYPLVAYSIIASRFFSQANRTIVSTDSEKIAKIALHYGAEVPFLRPKEFAQDTSGDLDYVLHAINWFRENEAQIPEYLAILRPVTPLRATDIIDKAIKVISEDLQATSLRTIHQLAEPAEKQVRIDDKGYLRGLFPNDPRPEYFNLPRQTFPPAFEPNGCVDIVKTDYVLRNNRLLGPRMIGHATGRVTEIDTVEDFDYLEYDLKKHGSKIFDYLKLNFRKDK